jgi:hypothetical protein
MNSGLEELIEQSKKEARSKRKNDETTKSQSPESSEAKAGSDLRQSLELLIERENPMSDAAKKALDRL